MTTRKIKDAELGGEKVYFASHAKATYMSDGRTVEDAINEAAGSDSERLSVSVSGVTEGFTVYVRSEGGEVIGSQTVPHKEYRIQAGVRYYVSAGEVPGYETHGDTEVRTAYAYAEHTVSLVYKKLRVTTIRINQTITDPATMITRIVDEGAIEEIRAGSHRYTGVFSDGVMTLKQLSDTDGTMYTDETAADLTTVGTDVWMKLPRFWYKCSEYATDQWDFSVSCGGPYDSTYKEWDGNDLIGAYEAYVSSSMLYSVSGNDSAGDVSQSSFKAYARARGEGFTLVKWKHHCMMAMLYYMQYGHTNCQAQIGIGTSSYSKYTGETNALGMADTVAGGNGDSGSINFWGLENWWGNKFEFVDNVVVNAGEFTVTEDDGTERKAGTQVASSNYISKMLFGANLDLIPMAVGGSATTGFCDYSSYSSSSSRVVLRSNSYAYTIGGVAFVVADSDASNAYAYYGSRLAFRGSIVIS